MLGLQVCTSTPRCLSPLVPKDNTCSLDCQVIPGVAHNTSHLSGCPVYLEQHKMTSSLGKEKAQSQQLVAVLSPLRAWVSGDGRGSPGPVPVLCELHSYIVAPPSANVRCLKAFQPFVFTAYYYTWNCECSEEARTPGTKRQGLTITNIFRIFIFSIN